MRTTTLARIRAYSLKERRFASQLSGTDKTEADNEPLPYATILNICGLDDAIWTTRTEEDYRWVQEMNLFFVRHIQDMIVDKRSLAALDTAERFLRGDATQEEMEKARIAADNAFNDATDVSRKFAVANGVQWKYGPFFLSASYAAWAVHDLTESFCSKDKDFSISRVESSIASAAQAYNVLFNDNTEKEWQTQEFLRAVS